MCSVLNTFPCFSEFDLGFVQVDIALSDGSFARGAVPSGASTEVQVIISCFDWATVMKKFTTQAGLCMQTGEDKEPCLVPLPS